MLPIEVDIANDFGGRLEHLIDLGGDLLRRFGGLFGQIFDLARDDRKSFAGIASSGRLNRGIERQQIGLAGDIADQLDDVADAVGRGNQPLRRCRGLSRLADRLGGNLR